MTKEEVLKILKENLFIHHSTDGEIYHECTCCSVISKTYQHLDGCEVQKATNDIEVVYNIIDMYFRQSYNYINGQIKFDKFESSLNGIEKLSPYHNYIYKVTYPSSTNPNDEGTGWFPFINTSET